MTTSELNPETITAETINLEESEAGKISHQEEIETIISSLEENDSAMVLKNDNGFLWKFQYSKVEVFVQITGESEDDLFTVWSVILDLPAKNELELMKKLLEMNWNGTFETCFSVFNNQIVISTQRTVNDLSATEISRAITIVATIADENCQELKSNYGQ